MIPAVAANISPFAWVLFIDAVGIALLSAYFHHKILAKKHEDDFKAYMLYFVSFFVLLFALPFDLILIFFSHPLEILGSLGFKLGNLKLGMLIISGGIPVTAVLVYVSTKNPEIREQYPFSKKACANPAKFVLYEICYLIFYYVTWEFTFRGVFLFSMVELVGKNATGIMVAILIQTIIATVYHLGHPHIEVVGAFFGSIIFGAIAYATQSILYTIFLHALIGILNDAVIYVRYRRNRKGG